MKSGFIESGDQRLHYQQWGSGPKLLVALHGYGNTAAMFAGLAGLLEHPYTTVALSLPFHGQSVWTKPQPWTAAELTGTIGQLMQEHGVDKISLAGFSLGGRICLKLLELMPQHIELATLIAPDGLVPNRFYRFVTANPAGKRIFAHFLDKPDGYMRLLGWLERQKLLDPAKKKFMDQYVSEAATRQFLKKVWPNLGALVPDPQKVRQNIAQHYIPVNIFIGRYDRVIHPENGKAFAEGAPLIKLHMLEKGHRVMDSESIGAISQSLLPS